MLLKFTQKIDLHAFPRMASSKLYALLLDITDNNITSTNRKNNHDGRNNISYAKINDDVAPLFTCRGRVA